MTTSTEINNLNINSKLRDSFSSIDLIRDQTYYHQKRQAELSNGTIKVKTTYPK